MSLPTIPDPSLQRKSHKSSSPSCQIDPEDLIRRLSIVQTEQKLRELNLKRAVWESQLLEARCEQASRIRSRTQSAPSLSKTYNPHVSTVPGPAQLPSSHGQISSSPARRTSTPSVSESKRRHVPQYAATGVERTRGQPRLKRESMLEPDMTEDNGRNVVEQVMRNWDPDWTQASKQRKRSSVLPRIVEDCAPDYGDAETISTPQDLSQGDETRQHSRRRSSLFDKIEAYWAQNRPDRDDAEQAAYHSDDTTAWNSKRSSKYVATESVSRRRSSILKKVEDHWFARSPPSDDEVGVKEVRIESDGSGTASPAPPKKSMKLRKSSFLAKLRF